MNASPVFYCCCACDNVVLAECAKVPSNSALVAARVLENIPKEDGRKVYRQDRIDVHVLVSQGTVFLAVCNQDMRLQRAAMLLDDMREQFFKRFGDGSPKSAVRYEYNTEFSPEMSKLIDYWTSDAANDKLSQVQSKLATVREQMVQNIEAVLDRGMRIEVLLDRSEQLQGSAQQFRRDATRLRRKMWLQKLRAWAMVGGVLAVIMYIIICFTCGPTFACARKHHSR